MPSAQPSPDDLRNLRRQHGLSATRCGELLGVSRQTVERWERRENDMPAYAFWGLCWILHPDRHR